MPAAFKAFCLSSMVRQLAMPSLSPTPTRRAAPKGVAVGGDLQLFSVGEVAEIVQAVLKGVPGVHAAHGEAAKGPVVTGGGKPRRVGGFRIGAVLALGGGDQVVHQLVVEAAGEPEGQGVVPAVGGAGVVVGGQNDDEGLV